MVNLILNKSTYGISLFHTTEYQGIKIQLVFCDKYYNFYFLSAKINNYFYHCQFDFLP